MNPLNADQAALLVLSSAQVLRAVRLRDVEAIKITLQDFAEGLAGVYSEVAVLLDSVEVVSLLANNTPEKAHADKSGLRQGVIFMVVSKFSPGNPEALEGEWPEVLTHKLESQYLFFCESMAREVGMTPEELFKAVEVMHARVMTEVLGPKNLH